MEERIIEIGGKEFVQLPASLGQAENLKEYTTQLKFRSLEAQDIVTTLMEGGVIAAIAACLLIPKGMSREAHLDDLDRKGDTFKQSLALFRSSMSYNIALQVAIHFLECSLDSSLMEKVEKIGEMIQGTTLTKSSTPSSQGEIPLKEVPLETSNTE